jgi:Zn-dependent protease
MAGNLGSALFGVAAISFLFVIVTLHELGHSFAAQYFDVPVKQIVLSPLGGVAQLNEMPEKPIQEFIIAIAGPAVNLVIAIIMGALAAGLNISLANPMAALTGVGGFTLTSLFIYVFFYNIFLALFNLIPAFPLDGGRVLRSLLAMRLEYVRATNIAATIGRFAALLLGIYGLTGGGFFIILIAGFIFMAGQQEAQAVRLRSFLRSFTVQQVFSESAYRLTPDSPLRQANDLMVFGGQRNFPVVEDDQLVGFLTQRDLLKGLQTAVLHSRIAQMMRRDIQPVGCDDDLHEVLQRMSKEGLEALPVTNGTRFLGLITQRHILELLKLLRQGTDDRPSSSVGIKTI